MTAFALPVMFARLKDYRKIHAVEIVIITIGKGVHKWELMVFAKSGYGSIPPDGHWDFDGRQSRGEPGVEGAEATPAVKLNHNKKGEGELWKKR